MNRLAAAAALLALAACNRSPSADSTAAPAEPASAAAATAATAPAALAAPIGACSHELSLRAVGGVIRDNLHLGVLMQDAESRAVARAALADGGIAPLRVDHVRTVARDDTVGRHECGGYLHITLPAGTRDKVMSNVIAAASIGAAGWVLDPDGLGAAADIRYTSQATDDRQSVYVELLRARELAPSAGLLAVAAAVVQRERAAPSAATATPVATDVCSDASTSSSVGIQQCAQQEFEVADRALNASYAESLKRLSPERQAALRAEQRAWLKDLRPACERQADVAAGGTAATLNLLGCLKSSTESRTTQIRAFE